MGDDLQALIHEGQRLRHVNGHALPGLAAQLRRQAGDDARGAAFADVFDGWGLLARGQVSEAEDLLARAQPYLDRSDDLPARSVWRGLRADLLARRSRWDEVLRIADELLALPVPAVARFRAGLSRSMALEWLGRHEDALRAHYEVLAHARAQGDAALLAAALGVAGGLQSSLLNLEDAARLCDEAWNLCSRSDWHGVVHVAGINRMGVLCGLERHAEALALSEAMWAREAQFPERHRNVRLNLHAMVSARAGELARAQTFLDAVRAATPEGQAMRSEWVWVQALVFNRQGRARDALGVIERLFGGATEQPLVGVFPVDRAQLHAQAALAHEAVGDIAQALAHERRAAAAREQAAAQAAHARRLTLQIDHELDTTRRARDQAVREGERARLEQQRLEELNHRLEAADAAKTRFLAAASHDLRQPVQALAMYLAALQRESQPAAREALMQRMERSLHALGGLFDGLLDVSRLDAGLVPVNAAPLRLDRLLQRLADEHALAARERGLALRLRLPRESATTHSDAVLLERIVRNLLDNALKYTPRGGVVLRLCAAGGQWRLQVRDTGVGIDPALHAQVFDEFFQVGNAERDRRQGLGLGLAIVRRSTALLGHALRLRSRPGRGSCFELALPRHATATEAGAVEPEHAPAASLWLALIDDDADVRDSLAGLLERWGHRVLHGADAPEVLRQWQRRGRPALQALITDLRLPGERTGLQAIDELRGAVGRTLPALVVTGDVAPERLRLLAEAGQPFLSKPLMPMRLRSWLSAVATPAH